MQTKVCVITTVHYPFDTRIFYKEAQTLISGGYDVSIIAAHDKNQVKNKVNIISLPKTSNKFYRMFFQSWKAFVLALKHKADIYHIHDPELLPVGLLIKLIKRRKVIYDVHEDFPSTIWTREYLFDWMKPIAANILCILEKIFGKKYDAIITADPYVAARMRKINSNVITLLNVPPKSLIKFQPSFEKYRVKKLVHIGSLSYSRGMWVLIELMELIKISGLDIELHIYAKSTPSKDFLAFSDAIIRKGLEKEIIIHDPLPYDQMLVTLKDFDIGLIPFLDREKYYRNIATKMFDYMASGLAIIASDLPPQRTVIEEADCGKIVEPGDVKKFADVVANLDNNPEEVNRMGKNGWLSFKNKYCWEQEAPKLLKLYHTLTSN